MERIKYEYKSLLTNEILVSKNYELYNSRDIDKELIEAFMKNEEEFWINAINNAVLNNDEEFIKIIAKIINKEINDVNSLFKVYDGIYNHYIQPQRDNLNKEEEKRIIELNKKK